MPIDDNDILVFRLTDLSLGSCIKVLGAIAAQIKDHAFWNARATRSENGVVDWRMVFETNVGGSKVTVTEREFFESLVNKRMVQAVSALREVLGSYFAVLPHLDLGGASHPYSDSDEGVAALSQAMRAALLLDPLGSQIFFQRYADQIDMEHAAISVDLIFEDYVKAYRWRNEGDVRLGTALVLGSGGSNMNRWNNYGLVSAARGKMSGSEFAAIVMGEIDFRRVRFSDAGWHEKRTSLEFTPLERPIYYATCNEHEIGFDIEDVIRPLLKHVPAVDVFGGTFGQDLRRRLADRWGIDAIEVNQAT